MPNGNTVHDDFSRRATDAVFEEYRASRTAESEGPCNLLAPTQIAQGVEILRCFPSRDLAQMLFDRYFCACEVLIHIQMIRHCFDSTWEAYGSVLDGSQDPERLAFLSTILCKNGMSPLPTASSPNEWFSSFTKDKLRWEIVGNLFAIFGLAAVTLSDWHPLFSKALLHDFQAPFLGDRKTYSEKMRQCAEGCLALCNDVDTVNEIVLSLMAVTYCLQSQNEGDTSQRLWRRHGGIISAVTALGLHREPETLYSPSTDHCFLIAEYRRRLFCYFFSMDKQVATIMGRPPALSRRYTTCKMPLDLSCEQMMAEGEELESIKARLDPMGWNTDGLVMASTIFRAWHLVSLIRDEILELALGPPSEDIYALRADLLKRSEEVYAQIPSQLHYQPNVSSRQDNSPYLFCAQMNYYQEYLLNRFLLDRLPEESSHEVKQDLVDTARKMLDTVLELCANRDRLTDFAVNFVWAITYSGIPSAGVLGVELLRQSKFPRELHHPSLPRSETIQNLSMFIGCLDWVRPSDGNFTLCTQMRKVIKRILDEVLELPPPPPPSSVAPDPMAVDAVVPADQPLSSMFGLEDDPEFLNWLNSGDWTRDMLQDPWT